MWIQKDSVLIYVSECLHIFYCKSFTVSDLAFRSLIHFEFVFMCGIRECSNFILFYVSQHDSLKRLFFLRCVFLPPFL